MGLGLGQGILGLSVGVGVDVDVGISVDVGEGLGFCCLAKGAGCDPLPPRCPVRARTVIVTQTAMRATIARVKF